MRLCWSIGQLVNRSIVYKQEGFRSSGCHRLSIEMCRYSCCQFGVRDELYVNSVNIKRKEMKMNMTMKDKVNRQSQSMWLVTLNVYGDFPFRFSFLFLFLFSPALFKCAKRVVDHDGTRRARVVLYDR